MLTDLKYQTVKNILLTPITTIASGSTIIEANEIKSRQTYFSRFDPDMSDVSVRFYEILYSELLNNEEILNKKHFKNKNFAGDTMNTGITTTRPKTKLPDENRHCLANFWLIPMYYGRKSSKVIQSVGTDDYMDRALDVIKKEFDNLQKHFCYGEYFRLF